MAANTHDVGSQPVHKKRALGDHAAPGAMVARQGKRLRKSCASSGVFFSVVNEVGVFLLGLEPGLRFGFLGPIGEKFISQLADLLNGTRLGFMGRAAFSHRLVDHIGDDQQALAQARTIGETLIQALFVLIFVWQFSIHELLNYTQY